MKYIIKLVFQYVLGCLFRMKELLRGNIVLANKVVGLSRIKLGTNVYISGNSRIISETSGDIDIGNNCKIGTMTIVEDRGGSIAIGDNTAVNSFCVLYGHGGLRIGKNVLIATHVLLIPANHHFSDPNRLIREQGETKEGIVIEDDVWIGAGAIVLDGVRIGTGSVIGAGAIVTKDIPPRSIAVGNPARVIKTR